MGRRLVYILIGYGLGALIAWLASLVFHTRILWQISLVTGPLVLLWAERKGKAPTAETLERPITLFSQEDRKD